MQLSGRSARTGHDVPVAADTDGTNAISATHITIATRAILEPDTVILSCLFVPIC
jgi:hypothetical protein